MEDQKDWEEEISLSDLVNILLKRKWLIAGVTLVVFLLTLLAWRFAPQTFRAEFQVTFAESSFPGEFKGEIGVNYSSPGEAPDASYSFSIPYTFSASLEGTISPELVLQELTKEEKIQEVARVRGFEALLRQYDLAVEVAPQKGEGFLVTISSRNEELCRRAAEALALQAEEELLSTLQKRHDVKVAFFRNLLKASEEKYDEARKKLLAFLERNNFLTLDTRIRETEESLATLQERKKALQQQSVGIFLLPLLLEVLQELGLIAPDRVLSFERMLQEQYEAMAREVDEKIRALEEEKKALEAQRYSQNDLVNEYTFLLWDCAFWERFRHALSLSSLSYEVVDALTFDGKAEIGNIKYSGGRRSLRLGLAVGVVAGLFVGVFVAFFAEFWEKARAQREVGNP
jgi:hypothetical protein